MDCMEKLEMTRIWKVEVIVLEVELKAGSAQKS